MVVHPDTCVGENSAHKSNFGGILLESEVFKMLQLTLENSPVQDTVVISGWNDSTPTAKKEFDFLIISLPLKTVIHIEVKRTLNKKSKDAATKQLDDGHSIISNKVPVPKKSNWIYIQYICFSHFDDSDEEISHFLESHILTLKIEFGEWWKDLLKQIPKDPTSDDPQLYREDAEMYLNILKYLLHQMFIQEDVITQGEFQLKAISLCLVI